ncbi:MAG TPA: K(+)-transporting ATPase subunit F [Acidimicrobiia bacterium]
MSAVLATSTADNLVALGLTVALVTYLVLALVLPERF